MSKKRHNNNDLFSGIFSDTGTYDSAVPPDQARMLLLLENGPKHADWLRGVFDNPDKLIAKLRAEGHVIRKVSLALRRWDWVYALSRKGKYCGIQTCQDPKIKQ